MEGSVCAHFFSRGICAESAFSLTLPWFPRSFRFPKPPYPPRQRCRVRSRGALVQRVQGLREELRRAAASSESGSGERVVVQSSSYECGFIKCWCALQDGGSAWVIFRGASCGELDTSKGSRLEIEPPYHRREIDDTTVLLVRSARSILGSA